MSAERYQRFHVSRPDYIGDEHWDSVDAELVRLYRSLEAGDDSQTIGDVKCLVEAVAKITLDIAGTPAGPSDAFASVVKCAHGLLVRQPGRELAYESSFGNLATQASKIAQNLGKIRNDYGGGHGRARQPEVRDEMVDLALDGGLIWVRWALRRLGLFSEGRPDELIRALVGEPGKPRAIFRSGTLIRRLEAANLPALEEHHQRALGVAVGQRAMGGTFVVWAGGVDPCLESDDTLTWTPAYRIGLAHGLFFDPDGRPTVSAKAIRDCLLILDPISDCSNELEELIDQVVAVTEPGLNDDSPTDAQEAEVFVRDRINVRPSAERAALERLADHMRRSSVA